MQSQGFFLTRAFALAVFACSVACSEGGGGDELGGTAGSGGSFANGGQAAVGGASASGGALEPAGGTTSGAGVGGSATAGMSGLSGMGGASGDDRTFVPEGLPNTPSDGEDAGLTLVAFTLVERSNGPELYAAVRNDADTPVCEGGMMTSFFDMTEALVTTTASVLESGHLYRLDGGAGAAINCIDPGQVAMTGSADLPDSIVIDELGRLEHRFPAFVVDGIVPIQGLEVTNVKAVTSGPATTYTGTLTNGLDVTASSPTVSIFPVNRVGRPLGMATSTASMDLPPGGSWSFETSSVDDPGAGYVAYPTASIQSP